MRVRQGRGGIDCKAKERTDFHRLAEKSLERLATGILKEEQGPTISAHKIERPDGPGCVKLILQTVFVSQAVEDSRRRLLRDRQDDQNRPKAALLHDAARGRAHAQSPPTGPGDPLFHQRFAESGGSSAELHRANVRVCRPAKSGAT